jgi:hypothetical protein
MESNMDYKKLKKDLLNKVGPSGMMGLIVSIDNATEKELLKLTKEFKLDLSNYMKD